jgi:dTDP-4-dehydrorhamnose reductase
LAKKRLLITGASGMLGYALCRRALPAFDVYGVCHQGEVRVDGVTPIRADLTDTVQLADCFKQVRPQAVIHAAALSQPNDCEQQPEVSEKINLRASAEIARLCNTAAIPLVFTSTDLVFDGQHPPYTEEDPVSPICLYGRHKANAEKAISEIYPDATICRMPLLLGHAPGTGSGFLGHMVRTLRGNQELVLFTDEIRTPVDTDSAARGLLMAIEKSGALLHLGGRRQMSRFSMGCLVADILKADHALLKTMRIEDLPMPAPRSPDVSLSSTRAFTLGYTPKDIMGFLEKAIPGFELSKT